MLSYAHSVMRLSCFCAASMLDRISPILLLNIIYIYRICTSDAYSFYILPLSRSHVLATRVRHHSCFGSSLHPSHSDDCGIEISSGHHIAMFISLANIMCEGSFLQRILVCWEYAALANSCKAFQKLMPSISCFVIPHRCQGLTGQGKQCTLKANEVNKHGTHSWLCCGNHKKSSSKPVFAQYVFALMPNVPEAVAAEDGDPIARQVLYAHVSDTRFTHTENV